MVEGQRPLAGMGLGDRDAGLLGERTQRVGRLAVADAAAGEDDRAPAGADPLRRGRHGVAVRAVARDGPHPLREHLDRKVEGVRLDVLRQTEEDRARVHRGREHAHHLRQGGDQLLGPVDPVPVADDRTEHVVRAGVLRGRMLQLLEHRRLDALGERVAGEEQDRDVVDGCRRGAGDHVRRPRTDRRRACERAQPVAELGVADRGVDHGLLVPRQVVGEVRLGLLDRLRHAADVAVPEDAPHAREESVLDGVALDMLDGQVIDERLAHGEPPG